MANTFAYTLKAQNNHPASSVIDTVTQQVPDQGVREGSLQSAVFEVTGTSASNVFAIGAAGIVTTNLAGAGAVTQKDPITGTNLNFTNYRGLFIACSRAATDTAPDVAEDVIASTTSLAIGTGSKAFTTAGSLTFVNGMRCRAVSATGAGANWMEGTVSYSGTTLTMTVDVVSGSGTLADWTIYGLPVAQITNTGLGGITHSTAVNLYEGSSFAIYFDDTSTIADVLRTKVKAVNTQAVTASLVGTTGLKVSMFLIGE
jgi:hypothetical protein